MIVPDYARIFRAFTRDEIRRRELAAYFWGLATGALIMLLLVVAVERL